MVTSERRSPSYLTARTLAMRRAVVGVDGGGTKTEAVILDARDEIVGQGVAGPSNPLRIGITNAAAAVREAIDKACADAHVRREDIVAAQIGLAGARRFELSLRMREALGNLGIGDLEWGDADIALYGVTAIAARRRSNRRTGSVVRRTEKRRFGPRKGTTAVDEGGGAWIARRACAL